jgi:hypothetical protein
MNMNGTCVLKKGLAGLPSAEAIGLVTCGLLSMSRDGKGPARPNPRKSVGIIESRRIVNTQ